MASKKIQTQEGARATKDQLLMKQIHRKKDGGCRARGAEQHAKVRFVPNEEERALLQPQRARDERAATPKMTRKERFQHAWEQLRSKTVARDECRSS